MSRRALPLALAASPDAKAFEEGPAAEVASKLFPPRSRGYRWRRMKEPSRLVPQETGAGAAQGLERRTSVFVEYHHLSLGGRAVYVGHAFVPGGRDRDPNAGRVFEAGGEAGSVVTECAVQDVVGALTGEKVDPAGTLCALTARPGRDPRGLPEVRTRPTRPPGRRGGA